MSSVELYIFVELAILASGLLIFAQDIVLISAGSVIGVVLWYMVSLYWGIQHADTGLIGFVWIFIGFATTNLLIGLYKIFKWISATQNPYKRAFGFDDEL
jgi:hypothetical protein